MISHQKSARTDNLIFLNKSSVIRKKQLFARWQIINGKITRKWTIKEIE